MRPTGSCCRRIRIALSIIRWTSMYQICVKRHWRSWRLYREHGAWQPQLVRVVLRGFEGISGDKAVTMDSVDEALVPETSSTPRNASRGEKPSQEVGDSTPSRPETAAHCNSGAGIPLGSVLELTWLSVSDGPLPITELRGQKTPIDLILRWSAQESSRQVHTPQQSTRLSVPASSFKRGLWELSASDSVARVALTPELLQPLVDAPNQAFVVLHVSLAPRRSTGNSWKLSLSLAVNAKILHHCGSEQALTVEAALCDQDGGSAGVASVLLRCGQPSQLNAPPKKIGRHEPQFVEVRLQLTQLKRFVKTKTLAANGLEVVLEASIIGQDASRAFRSRPLKLLEADADLSVERAVLLRVEDKHTQAIRLVVYRHSVKERSLRLAEALFSISSLESSADGIVVIPLLNSATTDKRSEQTQDRWGELLAIAAVTLCEVKNSSDELLLSAASSVLGESVYAAELGDVEGSLEIELLDAGLDGQADGNNDTKLTLDVKLRVPSSKWAATANTVPSVEAEGGFRFKQRSFATAIQWATKERAIPTLYCGLTLQVSGAAATKDKQSTRRGKNSGSGDSNSVVTNKSAFGSHVIQLPVLFTCPDEWMAMEVPINLSGDDDPTMKTVSVRLRLRMRLVPDTSSGAQRSQTLPGMASGHLTLSSARASGTFLKRHRSDDAYAIVLVTSAKPTQEKPFTASTAVDGKRVSWDSSVSCEVSRTEFAPVVIVQIFRILHSTSNAGEVGGNDRVVADGEHGELLGMLSMPLPGVVLHQKHLVSFSLPFATAPTSGEPDGASLRKAGMLTFDLQFVDDSLSTASRHTSAVKLLLQRILWTSTPASLALAIATSRSFSVRCSFSIVGGESLNEVLWSHGTTDLRATSDHVGEYLVDHSIRLSDATIAQLAVSTTATKSILIVKLTSSERSRDGECVVLGQAVVPIRGGWTAFVELEQSKWHKLYEVGRRGSGNPEAIGEIQLSIVNKEEEEEEATSHRSANGEHVNRVDEWLYLEVIEAIWKTPANISNASDKTRSMEAFVQLAQVGSTRKPQKTKSQWSTDAAWRWNGDGVFTVPLVTDKGEDITSYVLTLVVDRDQHIQVASQVEIQDYAQRSRYNGAFEDWISNGDNDAHVRMRISFVPPVYGSLKLNILNIKSLHSSNANDLLLERIAWRCTLVPTHASATTELKEGEARSLGLLEGSQLVLPLDSSRGEFASQALPALKLQLLGYGIGIQEVCLGEASTLLSELLWSLLQSPRTTHKKWVTLQSRHDTTQRVAVVLIGFELTRGLKPDPTIDVEEFASPEEWRDASAAVLTLWKKLFYAIDSDHNGRVDLNEFKELFMSHAEVFSKTQDGKMLLRVLFPKYPGRADLAAIERLFDEMDVNGDQGIEWLEFVDYMQSKLLVIKPHSATHVSPAMMPAADSRAVELRAPESANSQDSKDIPARELRRKRREDPHTVSTDTPSVPESGVESSKRLSVRQLSAATTRRSNVATASTNGASPRVESTQLEATLEAVQAMLDLEKQKSARLQDELRSLRLANHQLQMQRERELLEEKTKAQFLTEAIRSHEQALKDRDAVRTKHHTASIVLQSKVRMRLEQKKFHALRMLRWGAAVRIQCAYRCFVANKILRTLRNVELWKRRRIASATKLQRFVRLHLRRKERSLHHQARALSAVLLQKCVRRWLAMRFKEKYLKATVEVQTWTRRWLAVRELEQRRDAKQRLKHWIRGCVDRRRWCRVRVCVSRVQRWWRRANELRWEYLTHLEAAMCIQAVWRGHHNRQRLRELLMRRHERAGLDAQSELMAAAMGGEDGAVGDDEKGDAQEMEAEVVSEAVAEVVTDVVSREEADESAVNDQEVVEQDVDDSSNERFGVVGLGGDESTPPVELSADQSSEGDASTEQVTTTTAVLQSPNIVNAHEYLPSEKEIAKPEMIESRDHKTVVASDETETPAAAAPVGVDEVVGNFEAEDAEHSTCPPQIVDALKSLVDRIVAGTTNEAASEQASVPFESPEIMSVDAKRGDSEPTEQRSDDAKNALGNEREVDTLDDDCPLAGGEQPMLVEDETQKRCQGDDNEVERVLCQLLDAVAGQLGAISTSEQQHNAKEESAGEEMWPDDQNGDAATAPDDTSQLSDDVAPASTEADTKKPDEEGAACILDQSRVMSEDGVGEGDTVEGGQHGDRDEAEPLHPADPVESWGAEVTQSQDLSGTCMALTATEVTLHEESFTADPTQEQADLTDTEPSEGGVREALVAGPRSEDTTIVVDKEATEEQVRDENSLGDDATSTTTKSGEVIACEPDEHFEVRQDEAVGSAAVEDRVANEESQVDERVEAPNDDANPEPESPEAATAFDISDSDDERDSSRELESSHGSDDLQFMADADAVTHVQEAPLSHEELFDEGNSRQPSERADSEQQLLLDLDELTQPALTSNGNHGGDHVVVADLD